jgi:hypothetical protein
METLALEFKTNYPKNLYINLSNFNGKSILMSWKSILYKHIQMPYKINF